MRKPPEGGLVNSSYHTCCPLSHSVFHFPYSGGRMWHLVRRPRPLSLVANKSSSRLHTLVQLEGFAYMLRRVAMTTSSSPFVARISGQCGLPHFSPMRTKRLIHSMKTGL